MARVVVIICGLINQYVLGFDDNNIILRENFTTDLFFLHLQNTTTENETDQVYRTNPVLKYSKIPLKAPLLPLPYGQSQSSRELMNQGWGHVRMS